ncbi:hypothetical protein [Nonlabens xiamenensis]|uniref:hypothetical protein n=1 Tax=Nonlabens xiamenensis TaxID=2341043 RepID=UPI000F60A2EF|nr:hypothetical protein [Nonlabens xiamenensis]
MTIRELLETCVGDGAISSIKTPKTYNGFLMHLSLCPNTNIKDVKIGQTVRIDDYFKVDTGVTVGAILLELMNIKTPTTHDN